MNNKFKKGDKVEILDTKNVRNYSSSKGSVGEIFTLKEDEARRLNSGGCVHPWGNKYGCNYEAGDLKIVRAGLSSKGTANKYNVGDVVDTSDKGWQYVDPEERNAMSFMPSRKRSSLGIKNTKFSKEHQNWWYLFSKTDNWYSEDSIVGLSTNNPTVMPPGLTGLTGGPFTGFSGQPINNKNNMPTKTKRFKRGDRVALRTDKYGSNQGNPVWGDNGDYIAGTIVTGAPVVGDVEWDNGHRSHYYFDEDVMHLAEAEGKIKKKGWLKGSGVKLKTAELDALVIDAEIKTDIVSVLKQHQHAEKLFETWGLGEVIEYGRGMTMLFYGGPGTGKTWGANCIAKALETELLVINAGNIQTSEPGGANRNIQEAFATATKTGQVLFLDECDSLITNRGEVGMILSSEINTLLTEIEKFEGVCILATNRADTLDEALERRISLIAKFPKPNKTARESIWKKMLPEKLPLNKNVTIAKLAKEELTGGQIKNIVLAAARSAVAEEKDEVDFKHFQKAIARLNESKSLMGRKRNRQRAMVEGGDVSMGRGVDMDVDIDIDKVEGTDKKKGFVDKLKDIAGK